VRIIAGSAKGRVLIVPKNTDVRPTADRVKETIFNVLGQWFVDEERVLDLYAGVGGLGLEALSRGAKHATFVERDRFVMASLTENITKLGFGLAAKTLLKPVHAAVRQLGGAGATYHLVFADPPYDLKETPLLLTLLDETKVVAPEGLAVLEHDRREELPERVGSLERIDERLFGDTKVSFYTRRRQPET
jgi:16S rRNA (guanine966-N2)-methyltransferase